MIFLALTLLSLLVVFTGDITQKRQEFLNHRK
jgi:hypothetical protein